MVNQLAILLEDDAFRRELVTYKCALQRLRVRLRNNVFIAQLKSVNSILKKIRESFPPKVIKHHHEASKKSKSARSNLVKLLKQFIEFLDDSLDTMLQVYCSSQRHIRVGHLIQHLILIRSSLARIRLCFKALLIHATDLYLEMSNFDLQSVAFCSDTLRKHDCKARETPQNEEDLTVEQKPELIGQLIDRNTLKPVELVELTTSNPKKKRKR